MKNHFETAINVILGSVDKSINIYGAAQDVGHSRTRDNRGPLQGDPSRARNLIWATLSKRCAGAHGSAVGTQHPPADAEDIPSGIESDSGNLGKDGRTRNPLILIVE